MEEVIQKKNELECMYFGRRLAAGNVGVYYCSSDNLIKLNESWIKTGRKTSVSSNRNIIGRVKNHRDVL